MKENSALGPAINFEQKKKTKLFISINIFQLFFRYLKIKYNIKK